MFFRLVFVFHVLLEAFSVDSVATSPHSSDDSVQIVGCHFSFSEIETTEHETNQGLLLSLKRYSVNEVAGAVGFE